MDLQSVLREVDAWPVNDRIQLANALWDRLVDEGHEPGLGDDLKAELDRRIEEMDRNPEAGEPWEVVKARVLGRLRG
jgi:putative addiction module component (TIGR02574 family)